MSDCRVSSSTSSVLPSARSAIDTPRLIASVVAPRPPLAAKIEVIRPGFRGGAEPRNRASFSSAATRSTRSTGRRRNSRAPARRTRMTSSAASPRAPRRRSRRELHEALRTPSAGDRWLEAALSEGPVDHLTDTLDPRQQRELLLFALPQLQEFRGVGDPGGADGSRLDELHRHEEDQLGLVVLESRAPEERAEDRDIAEHRDLRHLLPHIVVDEARDGEGLAVLQVDRGERLVLANGG